LDVTPLSLRVESADGSTIVVIERSTSIPVQKTMRFSTTYDMQENIEIHVLMGEFLLARENASLGRFTVENIPLAPRGSHQVEVTFEVDINGILHVTAKDIATQKVQSVRITESSPGLTEEEIKRKLAEFNTRTRVT
jgi:molecular chaperone DnaK